MERSRLKGLVSRGLACILLGTALIAGQAPLAHADHTGDGGCWPDEPKQPSRPIDYRGPSGAFLVGAGYGGSFVAVDGDSSGVEVYGRVDTQNVFQSDQWLRIQVGSDGDVKSCGKGH